MFKKILQFFKDSEPVELWCGYYGNREHLHAYYHEKTTTEFPGYFNRSRYLVDREYCHDFKVYREKETRYIPK